MRVQAALRDVRRAARRTPQASSAPEEPRVDQRRDQRRFMPASHATHLQIRAIGQLDHASRMPLTDVGDHRSLRRAQLAAGQFDPADPTIARGDDAQQPRTRRGPQREGRVGQSSGGRSLIQDGHRVERRATARAAAQAGVAAASVHPARCRLARTVWPAGLLAGRSWSAAAFPVEPVARSAGGLAAYSCGGSHSGTVFPLRPRRAPAAVLCLFSNSTTRLDALIGVAQRII